MWIHCWYKQIKWNQNQTKTRLFHALACEPWRSSGSPKCLFNTLRPTQNGRPFADDIFKCIFVTENAWIPIKISLKFAPQGPINNILALDQIMAWRRPGAKPLSGPMKVRLPTHVCVTRPQWVLMTRPDDHPSDHWGSHAQYIQHIRICVLTQSIFPIGCLSWIQGLVSCLDIVPIHRKCKTNLRINLNFCNCHNLVHNLVFSVTMQ